MMTMRLLTTSVAATRGRERGFTLVEMLSAIFIFAVITIGIVPLLASSLRGATLSRSYTVGKNATTEAMERSRGLPYHVSFASQNRKVDLLDLYFPCLDPATQAGCNASGGAYLANGPDGDAAKVDDNYAFQIVCTPATVNPACPSNFPPGFTDVTFQAQFVQLSATNPDTYAPVAPAIDYAWNVNGKDLPPSFLLRLTVTGNWPVSGRSRSFRLTSILGDRQFGPEKVRGFASVEYTVQVLTSFLSGAESNLSVVGGRGESRVESRLLTAADQALVAGELRLTSAPDLSSGQASVLASKSGATSAHHAPPDGDPASVNVSGQQLNHTDPLVTPNEIAFLEGSRVDVGSVGVANQLPGAQGTFRINPGELMTYDLWVNNQADTTEDAKLLLDATDKIFSVRPINPLSPTTLSGSTSAVTNSLTSDRKVQTTATATFGEARLFPVQFIPLTSTKRAVILIDRTDGSPGFTASVDCKSTASDATASFSASYSANIRIWVEKDQISSGSLTVNHGGDGLTDGQYFDLTDLSSSNTTDPLAQFGANKTNPMIYEDPLSVTTYGSALDTYLFPVRHTEADHNVDVDLDGDKDPTTIVHDHPGYLSGWASRYNATVTGKKANGGRHTQAGIDSAIEITTRPSNPAIPQSGLNISIGKLSCEAVDNR